MSKPSACDRSSSGTNVCPSNCLSAPASDSSRLLPEEQARPARYYRLQGTPCSVGDHWSATRHRLNRRQAEILLPWEDECTAACVLGRHFRVRQPPEEADRRSGLAPQCCHLRTGSHDPQFRPNQIAGLDCQVDSFVADQARNGQEVPAYLVGAGGGVSGCLDGRGK